MSGLNPDEGLSTDRLKDMLIDLTLPRRGEVYYDNSHDYYYYICVVDTRYVHFIKSYGGKRTALSKHTLMALSKHTLMAWKQRLVEGKIVYGYTK